MNLGLNLILICVVLLIQFPTIAESIEIEKYYAEERDALLQLRDSVSSNANLHHSWTGPPCINNQSRWVGIACSNWHVVHLFLEGIQITGFLPPTFLQNLTVLSKLSFKNNSISGSLPNLTNLMHLEYVFLSYNSFSGSIPLEYIKLPNLKQLELQQNYVDGQIPPFDQPTLMAFNVSYNHLEGPIPETVVLQRFPKNSYDHNSNLCGSPLEISCHVPSPAPIIPLPPSNPPQDNKKNSLRVRNIALIVAAAILASFLVMLVFLCYYNRVVGRKTTKREQAGDGSMEWAEKKIPHSDSTEDPERTVELQFFCKEVPSFDLDDLLRASAEVLGEGKLGTTYKATMETGPVIAVKRLKNMNGLSKKEFIQQIQLLGKIRHENLVKILSFHYSKEEKLVIYEFVPNGNLFELLHENRGVGRIPLNWATRLAIIKGIANGLSFLHQSLPSHKVPHANLKSSNILIHRGNQSYHSKLTDFGFLTLMLSPKSSERLAIGKSPEFSQGKKLTHKTDVYCFGIILLEIITGRMPGHDISRGDDITMDDLSEWVRSVVNNDWSTDILDVEIVAAKEGHDDMLKLTEIALECTDMIAEKRPNISEVLRRIEAIEQGNKEND